MADKSSEPLNPKKVKNKKTFKEKVKQIRDNITLEPLLTCYVVPCVLSRLATQNLNLDKACRVNLGYGDEICDALLARKGDFLKEELAVQELIAGLSAWKNVIMTAIPSLLIIFIGAWSDRTGKRKICILVPIIGDLLACLSNIVSVYFFHEIPVELTMFFEAFLPAITGGWITTYMGAFSYVSDISSEESRTFRMGIANLCLTAGGPIGSALSGVLLHEIGYYGVFALSSGLFLFSISYGFLYIKDPEKQIQEKTPKEKSLNMFGFLKSFFDKKHVRETLQVAFKKGPNHRRMKFTLIMAAIAFIYGPAHGEATIQYLFTRYRFQWDALKYSFYHTFSICTHAIGAMISIALFSRYFGWDDSVLGLISNVSKIIGGLCTGFARSSFQMYLAVTIEMFNSTSFTAMRSISSKLVNKDELGKTTSLFNLTEVITSLLFGPIYSWIYMVTVKMDAGVVYYISTALTIPPIIIFSWFFLQSRKLKRENRKDAANQNENEPNVNKDEIENQLVRSIDMEDSNVFIQ